MFCTSLQTTSYRSKSGLKKSGKNSTFLGQEKAEFHFSETREIHLMGRKVELKISGHDVVNYGIGSSISCCEHLFKANLIAMSSADPPTNGQNASKAEPRWLTKNLRNTAKILSCMKPSLLPNVWSIVLRHLEQNKRQLDVRRQVDELLPWNKFSDCGSGEKSL